MNRNQNKKWALLTALMLASGLAVLPTAIHAATAVSGTEKANENGAEATDGTSAKSTAVGDNASAKDGGTAVGSGASATATGTDPVGDKVFSSTAVGDNASATYGGTALGSGASATLRWIEGDKVFSSTAVGDNASAMYGGTAIGSGATAYIDTAIAVGAGAYSERGIAIGYGARSDDPKSISEKNHSSIAIGWGATSENGIAIGHNAVANEGLAIGAESKTENGAWAAIGYGAVALSPASIAIAGSVDGGSSEDTVSVGSMAIRGSVGKGSGSSLALLGTVADNSSGSIAIGGYASSYWTVALGHGTQANSEHSVTIGAYSATKEDANGAVAIGEFSIADEENTVAVGNAKQTWTGLPLEENRRRITYVADGIKDTDAATYGQLVDAQAVTTTSGEGESQTTTTTYTTYTPDSDGIVTVLTNNGGTAFKIKVGMSGGGGATYTGDNKTISISDTNVISVKTEGTVTKDSTGIVTGGTVYNAMVTGGSYDSSTGKLHFTNGKGEDAFSIAIEGSGVIYKGDDKTIGISDSNEISVKYDATDLTVNDNGLAVKKDGKVEAGNEGLVTGGTVYDALQDMNHRTEQLTNDINKVGAGAAALAALRPEGFDPDDKWSFAVGYGHYKNANAGALGAFFKPNADTTVSFSSTVGNGDPMMNAGVSFKLGQRGKNGGVYRHAVELVARVDALEATDARHEALIAAQADQIAAQRQEIASQRQEIAALRADNEQMKRQIATILSKMEMSDQVMPSAR